MANNLETVLVKGSKQAEQTQSSFMALRDQCGGPAMKQWQGVPEGIGTQLAWGREECVETRRSKWKPKG